MKDYFSHDYNSRNDKKLVNIFMKYGLEAIGAYWCIVEMLYEEGGFLNLSEYERITFELRTKYEIVTFIINDSELFKNDGQKFWSETAIERLKLRADKSEKARESIMNRWNKKNDTNVLQSKNECNTIKVKESKENNKEKDNIKPVWKTDFAIYKSDLQNAFNNILNDKEFISTQEQYYSNVDIIKSIHKSCINFWATEEGWMNKKSKKTKDINWKTTFAKSIDKNKVYKNDNR